MIVRVERKVANVGKPERSTSRYASSFNLQRIVSFLYMSPSTRAYLTKGSCVYRVNCKLRISILQGMTRLLDMTRELHLTRT